MELLVQAGARAPSSEDSGPPGSIGWDGPASPRPDQPSPAAQTAVPGPWGPVGLQKCHSWPWSTLSLSHVLLSAPKGFTQSPSWASRGSSCLLLGSWTSAWTLPAVSLLMSFGTLAPKAWS